MMVALRLKSLRESSGMSKKQTAAALGISYSAYCNYESGIRTPNGDILVSIANYYNTTTDYLLGSIGIPSAALPMENVFLVPVFSSIRMGYSNTIETEELGYEPASNIKNSENYSWLLIKDKCMSPLLNDGDQVLVQQHCTPSNGDLVVVMLSGTEGFVRKFQNDAYGIILIPLNPKYSYIFIPYDKFDTLTLYGVVIERKTRFR